MKLACRRAARSISGTSVSIVVFELGTIRPDASRHGEHLIVRRSAQGHGTGSPSARRPAREQPDDGERHRRGDHAGGGAGWPARGAGPALSGVGAAAPPPGAATGSGAASAPAPARATPDQLALERLGERPVTLPACLATTFCPTEPSMPPIATRLELDARPRVGLLEPHGVGRAHVARGAAHARPIAVNSIERPGSRSVIRIFRSKVADIGPTAWVTRTREFSASTTVTVLDAGDAARHPVDLLEELPQRRGRLGDDELLAHLHPPAPSSPSPRSSACHTSSGVKREAVDLHAEVRRARRRARWRSSRRRGSCRSRRRRGRRTASPGDGTSVWCSSNRRHVARGRHEVVEHRAVESWPVSAS